MEDSVLSPYNSGTTLSQGKIHTNNNIEFLSTIILYCIINNDIIILINSIYAY